MRDGSQTVRNTYLGRGLYTLTRIAVKNGGGVPREELGGEGVDEHGGETRAEEYDRQIAGARRRSHSCIPCVSLPQINYGQTHPFPRHSARTIFSASRRRVLSAGRAQAGRVLRSRFWSATMCGRLDRASGRARRMVWGPGVSHSFVLTESAKNECLGGYAIHRRLVDEAEFADARSSWRTGAEMSFP